MSYKFSMQPNFNVPIEVFRSVIAVAESGSISKAALKLGLSQPAISAQLKRLQVVVGGEIFIKTPNGATPTGLGKLMIEQGRRVVEAHDQILRLGGHSQKPVIRLGITQVMSPTLFERIEVKELANVFLVSEQSSQIRKGLVEGYVDMALIFLRTTSDVDDMVVFEKEMPLTWIKSPNFVLSPGSPIPLVTLPDDDWLIQPLKKKGTSYRLVLRSSDHSVRLNAIRVGLGVSCMPVDFAPEDLMHANDYYLPELDRMRMAICARPDMDNKVKAQLSTLLKSRFIDR